jgi:ribosomal protein S13
MADKMQDNQTLSSGAKVFNPYLPGFYADGRDWIQIGRAGLWEHWEAEASADLQKLSQAVESNNQAEAKAALKAIKGIAKRWSDRAIERVELQKAYAKARAAESTPLSENEQKDYAKRVETEVSGFSGVMTRLNNKLETIKKRDQELVEADAKRGRRREQTWSDALARDIRKAIKPGYLAFASLVRFLQALFSAVASILNTGAAALEATAKALGIGNLAAKKAGALGSVLLLVGGAAGLAWIFRRKR